MLKAWRIVKRRLASQAFDGEGARIHGGRWNSPGRPAVYLSETRALATLEVLVGLTSSVPIPDYVLIGVSFDESLVDDLASSDLPDGWDAKPPTMVSQHVGDRWLEHSPSAILRVPSVVVSAESNYVLNPQHGGLAKIVIGVPEELDLDPKLLRP